MEGYKQCPQCKCVDVPMDAWQCPFCGYQIEKEPIKKADVKPTAPPPVAPPPQTQTSASTGTAAQQNTMPTPGASTGTAPVPTTGSQGTSNPNYKTYQKDKKKKHRVLKFVLLAIILVYVWSHFIHPSAEEGKDMSEASIASPTPTEIAPEEPLEVASDAAEDGQQSDALDGLDWNEDMEGTENLEADIQYILPLSDQVYLTREDIEGLTADELRIARNELYARHGRLFRDEALQAYFDSCEWYVGTVSPDDFSDSVFNEYERANKDLIVAYEHELGVNGQ